MAAYGSLCTEFYDLDKPSAPAEAPAFYVERARNAGGRILEPMCGSAGSCCQCRLPGCQSTALTRRPRCSQRAVPMHASLGLMSVFSCRTWLLWSFLTGYSMAFIPSGWIGLITEEEELHRVLSRISAHLEPNGTLLLELVSGADLAVSLTETKPRAVQCADGSSIAYQCNASRSTTPDTICYSGTYTSSMGLAFHRNGSRGVAATAVPAPESLCSACNLRPEDNNDVRRI